MTLALCAAVAVLLAALVAVNIAYIRHLERKDARHDGQVNRLLQRIQAPERAVIEHSLEPVESPEHVGFEDDAEFWRARGVRVAE